VLGLSADATARLRAYSWPGNIRELRNVMERAVAICPGQVIGPEHLPPLGARAATPLPISAAASGDGGDGGALREAVDAVERARVLDVLRRCGGNQSQAAKSLGIARNTLAARLRRWGVDPRRL
jgi:DNA-binding NtrC family response regulator